MATSIQWMQMRGSEGLPFCFFLIHFWQFSWLKNEHSLSLVSAMPLVNAIQKTLSVRQTVHSDNISGFFFYDCMLSIFLESPGLHFRILLLSGCLYEGGWG